MRKVQLISIGIILCLIGAVQIAVAPSPSSITVVSPNGGENWVPGTTQTIRWTYAGDVGSTVTIEAIKGAAVLKTLSGVPTGSGGAGSFSLAVPSNTPIGTDYTIRITSTSDPGIVDTSDSAFSVADPITALTVLQETVARLQTPGYTTHTGWYSLHGWGVIGGGGTSRGSGGGTSFQTQPGSSTICWIPITTPSPGTIKKARVVMYLIDGAALPRTSFAISVWDGGGNGGASKKLAEHIIPEGTFHYNEGYREFTFDVNQDYQYAPAIQIYSFNTHPTEKNQFTIYSGSFEVEYLA